MKVNNEVTHSVAHSAPSAARPAAANSVKTTAAAGSVDSVKISDASRALVAGTSDVQAPFDVKRVEAIKSAISSGQFKVNPEAVADKILNSASQLLTGAA